MKGLKQGEAERLLTFPDWISDGRSDQSPENRNFRSLALKKDKFKAVKWWYPEKQTHQERATNNVSHVSKTLRKSHTLSAAKQLPK